MPCLVTFVAQSDQVFVQFATHSIIDQMVTLQPAISPAAVLTTIPRSRPTARRFFLPLRTLKIGRIPSPPGRLERVDSTVPNSQKMAQDNDGEEDDSYSEDHGVSEWSVSPLSGLVSPSSANSGISFHSPHQVV